MHTPIKITVDQGKLVKNIDRLQVDNKYLEDSGGEQFL